MTATGTPGAAVDGVAGPRLEALSRLGLLERSGELPLTSLTRLAAYITGAAAAAVHIFDDTTQHRIAATGAPLGTHPAEDSMCPVVVETEQPIVCADATRDERFAHTSFVQGADPVRFFAAVPLVASDGVVLGTLCAFDTAVRELGDDQVALLEDVAAQVVSNVELRQMALDLGEAARRDALTGLANRVVLLDRIAQSLARRRRHGGEVVVIAADLDGFKATNDTYGHAAGDAVLVELAARLRAGTRDEDTLARLGGDEFVIVAEVADESRVEPIVGRILGRVQGPFQWAGNELPVTASAGFVVAQEDDDVATLLARADAAMYAEKASRLAARLAGDTASQ